MQLCLLYVVLKAAAIRSDAEQSVQHLIVLVETLPEAQARDFNFVRKNFSVENPLFLLVSLPNHMVFFEQTHASVSIGGGEVGAVFADYQVFDGRRLLFADFQWLCQLLVLARGWLNYLDLAVTLAHKQFGSVWRELHSGEDFVDVALFLVVGALFASGRDFH